MPGPGDLDDEAAPREAAYDAYVDAALAGGPPEPATFLTERGIDDPELRSRLEAVHRAAAGPVADTALPFERLGPYRVLRRLDAGGMSTVYLGVEERLGRVLALKVLRPEHQGSATQAARFEREAQVVARLRHPNIVTIFGVGEDRGTRFLAMEYVEGEGLDEAIRRAREDARPLPIATCVRWAIQVAGALHAAHEAGVVHRDVKPSNVRITPQGDAVLLDFGIAAEDGTSRLTVPGRFLGTAAYAAPEQFGDGRTVDARTDVHALGLVLYESLTGVEPFAGATEAETLRLVVQHEIVAARMLRRDVPRDLDTVVGVATERDPARRYASAAAFAEDLRAVLAVRPIAARPPGPLRRTWKAARRHPVAATVLVAAVLTAAAFVAVDRVRTRAAAQDAIRDARAGVAAFREECEAARAAETEFRRLDLLLESVYMTPDQDASFAASERAVHASRRAREERFHAVLDSLRRAERLDADVDGTEDVRGALYVERWRDAHATHDDAAAAFYRQLAVEHGHAGEVGGTAAGGARLVVTCDAPGASARIFRWEVQSEIDPAGETRLVPVPLGCGASLPPGTWAFRLVRGHGPLLAGDLVTRVDGRAPGPGDWPALRDRLSAGAPVDALGVRTRGPVDLPPGADVRITTQPLEWVPSAELLAAGDHGATADVQVPADSLLVVVRAPGRTEARYAVPLAAGGEHRIDAHLVPEEDAPAGFVRVVPAQEASHWIQEREVTAAEYLEFLNDAATLAAIGTSDRPTRFPRNEVTVAQGGHWPRGEDGRYRIPSGWTADWPALGVSCDDAEAYCAWWTRREAARGGPWRAALPTLTQWYLTGVPVGERLYVFGNRFHPKWVASCFAHETATPTPVMLHPRDESVFGAFDMSGSVWEWSATWWDESRNRRRLAGGSWARAPREFFKVWGGLGKPPESADDESGFRMVLTLADDAASAERPR